MFTLRLTRAPRYVLIKSFFLAIGWRYLHDLSHTFGSVRSWSRDQNVIFQTADYLFLNRNFFTGHLSITIKRLTRYNQKVVLAAMLEGKSMPYNMAAITNHAKFLKNQSAIKYLP